jgi:hypothetical protein
MINRNWIFGDKGRLDFSTTSPTALSNAVINTFEGCASISDATGNLILYTDGQRVWDSTNTLRATGLFGNPSSTQSAIIVPNPGNSAQYYIFTADGATGGNNHVNGIVIDTSTWLSTPLSALMAMPPTTGFSSTEKITAIQHANCKDFWVVTIIQALPVGQANVGIGLGTFRVFLVNSTGVQYVGDTPMNVNIHDVGYLKASRDGRQIAVANWSTTSASAPGNVLVYPFDNSTAVLDLPNLVTIAVPAVPNNPNHPRAVYGVEFSPNGNILYYSVLGGTGAANIPANNGYVFQHDLLSNSSAQVGVHQNLQGRYALGALQLGMDDRIYVAQDGERSLGVIANPNVLGTGCNLTFSSLPLFAGSTCYMGLPNLISNPCPCPCERENCEEEVDDANRTLNDRAGEKFFTIVANGQVVSATCEPAFALATFTPIFTLHWGEASTDRFESHDTEIIYIRIRNPFRNVVFKGVRIFNIRIIPNQVLPDGEDALQLIPAEIACFDMIEPCSYISRDFAFLIQNAVVQGYQIAFDYCIEEVVVVGSNEGSASFDITVVAS